MAKLLLISIIIATVAIPLAAAGDPSSVRGLKKALVWTFLFDAAYVLALLFIYPRIL